MLALGETCFGASGRFCGVDDLGVTLGRNLGLGYENFTADRAVLALGETCFGASGSLGGGDDHGMAEGRDLFMVSVAATDTGYVGVPTNLSTGGILGGVRSQVVSDNFGYMFGNDKTITPISVFLLDNINPRYDTKFSFNDATRFCGWDLIQLKNILPACYTLESLYPINFIIVCNAHQYFDSFIRIIRNAGYSHIIFQ